MKKVFTSILVLLMAILFIDFEVEASNGSSFNKIRSNYFEVDLYALEETSYSYILFNQKEVINLDANKEYFFLSTYVNKNEFGNLNANWDELPLLPEGLVINTYDEDGNLIQLSPNKKLYSNEVFCGYAFTLDSGYTNISFQQNIMEGSISQNNFREFYDNYIEDFSKALVLIEATKLKHLPNYTGYRYQYNGNATSYNISNLYFGEDLNIFLYGNTYPVDDDEPIFNPNDSLYITNVNAPISIEEMINEIGLSAVDEIDGDISDCIEVVEDGGYLEYVYSVNNTKDRVLGTYPIIFSVCDNSDNIATCTINIEVVDNTPPEISSSSILEYNLSINETPITIDEIISNMEVNDNHSNVKYHIVSENYTGNEQIVGNYNYVICFTDQSGNSFDVTVLINNSDQIAPVFSFSDTEYIISYHNNANLNQILELLNISVSDNYYDVDYVITEDNYTNNLGNIGTYNVLLNAIDGNNNKSELLIKIHIIDDKAPMFFVNDAFIEANIQRLISEAEIKAILIEDGHVKDENFTIQIMSDNYSDNYDKTGEYQMRVKLTYDDGEIEYKAIGFNVKEVIKKVKFFTKVWNQIKKISQFIWNIIKWPFEQVIELFR